ncbi:MAG: hypothetical protein R3B06_13510 [Kofleriaceae bacterium]
MHRLALTLAALAAAACTDFATPNQLERATIIAVVAEPPVVQPGDATELTVVVADATGVIERPATWTLTETFPGVAPLGTLTGAGASATYRAPTTLPDRGPDIPPIDTAAVTVDTADGRLTAIKAVAVVPTTTANPRITALTVGGADATAAAVPVTRGQTVTVQVTTDPATGDDARFAWYSPVGDIQYYQSNPCDLVVADDAVTGPLIVVVRDGQGGVVWRQIELQVP